MHRSGPVRLHTIVLAVYTLAALILTWPLLRHFTTHVPGDGIDDPSLAWNLWWIKERLVDQGNLDIFHVDWMFHPIAINLGFYTLTPLNGLLSIPLQTAFTLVIANNLILLSSFILGGFGVYLLTRQEIHARPLPPAPCPLPPVISYLPPLFAGFVYAFASAKLFYISLGQFNIASSQWVPFCALYLLRLARATTWRAGLRNAVFAGLFLTLQAWAELTYASFLLIFAALVFTWSFFLPAHNTRIQKTEDRRQETGDRGQRIEDDESRITHHATRNTQQTFGELSRAATRITNHATRNTQHATRITHHTGVLWTRLTSFALCALVFLLGIAPFLWAMIPDLLREGDFFASGGGFADSYSADLAGYLLPTRLHPFWGEWVTGLPFPNDKGQQIFLGYSVMLLSILGSVKLLRQPSQRWRGGFWLVAALFFGWMTLGSQLHWMGESLSIPGPFELISRLPFFSGNRYPSRYSVMLLMCVAVLAGAGLQFLLGVGQRWMRDREIERSRDWKIVSSLQSLNLSISQSLTLGFMTLFLLEHLSIPLPLSDFRVPAIYQRLAAEAGDFTVLELPTGWRNGARVLGKSDILIMMQQWYQTVHGKRRLGGNTSRNPPYKFQYFSEAPLIGDLIALMNAEPASTPANDEIARVVTGELDELIARDRPLAGQVLDFLGVKYVTVHVEKSPPALLRFIDEALPLTLVDEWRGPDWSSAESTIRLYTVNPSASSEWTINLAAPEGRLYLAEGWSTVAADDIRYATRPCADLLLNLPVRGGEFWLQLLGPQQTATLTLNGQPLGTAAVPTSDAGALVSLSAGQADELIDRLQLCFDRRTALPDLALPAQRAGWPVGDTGAVLTRSIVVQSAGNDVGDFAHIWVDGVEVALNRVGYNLVALDAAGTVQEGRAFNTLATADEAQAMADWLHQWPPGTIIAGAVRDEASSHLTAEAVVALQQIGVATDLRSRFRWSHAFIGVVGAPPTTAIEAASLLQPATVHVGIAVDAPHVYGGVGQLRFAANR